MRVHIHPRKCWIYLCRDKTAASFVRQDTAGGMNWAVCGNKSSCFVDLAWNTWFQENYQLDTTKTPRIAICVERTHARTQCIFSLTSPLWEMPPQESSILPQALQCLETLQTKSIWHGYDHWSLSWCELIPSHNQSKNRQQNLPILLFNHHSACLDSFIVPFDWEDVAIAICNVLLNDPATPHWFILIFLCNEVRWRFKARWPYMMHQCRVASCRTKKLRLRFFFVIVGPFLSAWMSAKYPR